MNHNRGYTLIFTLAVVALLTGIAAMLVGPSLAEKRAVELHYRNVQARYLSLAGLEQAKVWAAQGVLTNELYLMANGVVDTTMGAVDGRSCRVISVGRLRAPWRSQQIVARIEETVPLAAVRDSTTTNSKME